MSVQTADRPDAMGNPAWNTGPRQYVAAQAAFFQQGRPTERVKTAHLQPVFTDQKCPLVLHLIRDLAGKHDGAAIFVSLDLAVVRAIADRITVLHDRKVVESNVARELCARPLDPHTRSLLGWILEIPA